MLDIVIDTREQTPWYFPPEEARVSRAKLDAGDYALKGDNNFAIERKSLPDFVSTITGKNWSRFKKELTRMINFPARIIMVEANIEDVYNFDLSGRKISSGFLMSRWEHIEMNRISIVLAGNPTVAAALCINLLRVRSKNVGKSSKITVEK